MAKSYGLNEGQYHRINQILLIYPSLSAPNPFQPFLTILYFYDLIQQHYPCQVGTEACKIAKPGAQPRALTEPLIKLTISLPTPSTSVDLP